MMRPFRAFSDYLYEAPVAHYLLSLEDFHQAVHRAISNHKKCQTQYSIRACAYNASLEHYKVMRERESYLTNIIIVNIYLWKHMFIIQYLKIFNYHNNGNPTYTKF